MHQADRVGYEELFRRAELAGGTGSFVLDLTSNAWQWGPHTAALFGFDPATPQPSIADWERSIFVDDVPKLRAAVAAAVQAGAYYTEFRVRRSDGRVHWIAGKGETVADEAGRARWLCGSYYDITDRKGLEARLLALNETLEARVVEIREEARTLEILNETAGALACELSLERLVQIVTDAAVELTGAQFGAFFHNIGDTGGQAYGLYAFSGAPREAFGSFPKPLGGAIFAPTLSGRRPARSDDLLHDPLYGRDASPQGLPAGELPVRSYLAIPVVSRSGDVMGALVFGHSEPGTFTDRAERIAAGIAGQAAIAVDNARLYEESQRELEARRAVEQALQHLNETLEERVVEEVRQRQLVEETLRQAQKMEAIGQLTGGIAHDFNNLLTVIYGNVETMQRQLAPEDERQRILAAALRGASRAALLTQRLLAFSRRQPLAPQPLVVDKLVAGMSDLLRRTLGESIDIETVLAGGLWETFVDFNQLENAVLNLAVNARDAMPDGGKLTVETANCHLDGAYARRHADVQPGQYVGLFITDTGIGMADDVVVKAFEPFFTTKPLGEGTGLGLSQVYGFIKQSGGHVKIYSEVGQGTTVRLYLPRHRGLASAGEDDVKKGAAPRSEWGETVLVVEDDPDVRSYTIAMVGDLGYRVLSAEDGAMALRVLDAHNEVRLLFTDVGLPRGMNGRQLAEEVLRRRPRIRVLFTTGYARNAIVHHGRLDTGVDVLLKPFTYTDLGSMIRKVLDR